MLIPSSVRTLSLAVSLIFALGAGSQLRAETLEFPKGDPSLKIEVPAGWKVDWIDANSKDAQANGAAIGGTRVQLSTEGGAADLAIKELPDEAKITDEASAKAEVANWALKDMKSLEASKCSDPVESMVAGHKAYTTKVTTGLGSMDYTVFTPDGEDYFAMFSMNGGAAPIIALIKAVE